MEAFDDVQTPYGSGRVTYALARPVAKPFADARSAGELFIALAQELKLDLGVKDMPELLYKHAYALGAPFRAMINEGVVHTAGVTLPASPLFYNWEAIQAAASARGAEGDLQVAPVTVLAMGTPQTAIPPFATKVVTDYQLKGKYSVAQMNGATAAKLKVRPETSSSWLPATMWKSPWLPPFLKASCPIPFLWLPVLAIPPSTSSARARASNVLALTSVCREPGTGLPVWGLAGVKAARA